MITCVALTSQNDKKITLHTRPEQSCYFLNWILGSDGDQGYSGNHPQCSVKSLNLGFWRKSIFCVLGGTKKLFWAPKTFFCIRNLTLGGVILLKLSDPCNGFEVINFKIAIFRQNQPWISPKLWPRSKCSRSMTPPESEISNTKEGFEGSKKSFA